MHISVTWLKNYILRCTVRLWCMPLIHFTHVRTYIEMLLAYLTIVSASWASYQIRKIAGCVCTGNAGLFPPPPTSKETVVSDPGMHHGTSRAVMYGGIAIPRGRKNVPSIPGACATRNVRYLVRGPWTKPTERNIALVSSSVGPLCIDLSSVIIIYRWGRSDIE